MTTIIKHVHVLVDGVLHSFVPGDERPEWAADIITNPDVLGEFSEPESEDGEAGDVEKAASETESGEEKSDDGESGDGAPDRDALVARAKELGLRLRKDMSDEEIAAAIASKE